MRFAVAALALMLLQCASSYKPVIMLHGIDDNAAAFGTIDYH